MRRIASALFIVLLALGLSTPLASADPVGAATQTGTYAGTSTIELQVAGCSFVHQVFTGTYDPDQRGLRNGTYTMDVCVEDLNDRGLYAYSGTFEIRISRRLSLRGTVTGNQTSTTIPRFLEGTLTVTASPGFPHPVRGTITVLGSTEEQLPSTTPGTTVDAGTFTADLHIER